MTEELLIPFSLAKRYLASKGLRVSPEASNRMQQHIKEYALSFAEKVSELTKNKKRQTIYEEEVIEAFANTQNTQ